MDKLINCSRCDSDACYVEEINGDINISFCYGCGFQTNSIMKEGEKFYDEQLLSLPELYKDLIYNDGEKNWIPTSVNVPEQGMIFANGSSSKDWHWAAVKAVPVTENEKEKYPIPNKKGKFYEWRMDMNSLKEFKERDFMDALSYLEMLPE
tara:strand:+ start:702 stop:1154 length:453 start_codon:yes stop_codon:yes gene_type:complete